jgi:hypothetical protein
MLVCGPPVHMVTISVTLAGRAARSVHPMLENALDRLETYGLGHRVHGTDMSSG